MATKTLELEILNVGTPVFTKTARGGYNSIELAYKNHTFEGKVEGKKLVDFNDKAVFAFIKDLVMGDKIVVTAEKGDNDQYWKWVAVEKADGSVGAGSPASPQSSGSGESSQAQSSSPTKVAGSGVGRVTGNNYETAEERAKKQVYIVRQSSIANAIAFASATGPTTTSSIIELAKQFEAYVLEKPEIPF